LNWRNSISTLIKKSRPTRQQTLGQEGENIALTHLSEHGLALVERNFRRPFGEIDLIMRDKGTLVFIEVRRRANSHFGGAAASITYSKQRRLILAAQAYLSRYAQSPPPCRFDVVAIDGGQVTWIKNVMS
jgi:putative endonuclease